MDKQTKTLLGLGAIAVALYFILRPKGPNAQTPPTPNSTSTGDITPINEGMTPKQQAQSYLDMLKAINDNFNYGSIVSSNGKQIQIGKDGKELGYWKDNSNFVFTNGDDIKRKEYTNKVSDLGFAFLAGNYKAITPDEYEKLKF